MRNINLIKVANILAVFVMLALVALPLVALAQFPSGGLKDSGPNPVTGVSTATQLVIRVINILLAIAGLIAVIFLIIGGFKYITSGGNEETAEAAKKTITNAIIGIVVIILAFVIVTVISNALSGQGTAV